MKAVVLLFLAIVGFACAGTVFNTSNYPHWDNWYATTTYLVNWYWQGDNTNNADVTYSAFFQDVSTFTFSYYDPSTIEEPTTYWTTEYWTTLPTSYLQSSSNDAFSLIPCALVSAIAAIALF